MLFSPAQFLILCGGITVIAGVAHGFRRRGHVRRIRALGQEWRMHFSAGDRFHLGWRVAQRLNVPGAASVRISDLLYAIEGRNYRYVFTTEYTLGVLRGRTGVRCAGTLAEPRDHLTRVDAAGEAQTYTPVEIEFAPPTLPLVEQYRRLLGKCEGE